MNNHGFDMNPENGEEMTTAAASVTAIGYTRSTSVETPPYTHQNGVSDKQSPLSDVQFDEKSKAKKKKGFFKKNKDDEDEEKKSDSPPPVSYTTLFRFAKPKDKFLVFIGILMSILAGLSLPAMVILFGRLTNAFVCQGMLITVQNAIEEHLSTEIPWGELTTPGWTIPTLPTPASTFLPPDIAIGCVSKGELRNATIIPPECKDITGDNFYHEIQVFGGGVAVIGVIQLILGYFMVTALNAAAENQVHLIRSLFLKATLRQDVAWFDVHQAGEFATRTADDLGKLQEGFGEKLGMFLMFLTTFIASMVNAFVHGWKLTLVMLSVMPLMVIAGGLIANAQTSLTDMELKAYAKAGNIAEEVLSAVRTVIAFGGEAKEVQRYNDNLVYARQAGIKRGLLSSIGGALMWFIIFASYSLAFWYGVKLILEDRCTPDPEYDPSVLIVVFFSVLMGAMNMGQSSPYIEAFASGRSAAAVIFDVIDRIPPIDSESDEGVKPLEIVGNVEFDDVYFDYPSRADVKILRGLSLKINRGETVALVGESGCGKSTTIQLLQRFYDPLKGTVKVDGIDIKTMNLGHLRDHIGVVGQEPVLFGTTIAENIRYGKEGVQMEAVHNAAKEANAHDFIMKLPKQYDTLVGERGAQLSGGQKQRIAIARALVRDPKILLLDEATSALDSESESVVQQALEKASQGRTTIIIAHRLSTVRNADKIVAISEGRVAEIGTHDELMKLGKVYFQLVTLQVRKRSTDEGDNVSVTSLTMKEANLEYRKSKVSMHEGVDEHLVNMSPVAFGRVGSLRKSQRDRARSMSSDKGSGQPLIDKEEEEQPLKPSYWRLLKANTPEWPYVVLGLIGSIGMGFSIVGYAILFGEVMGVLSVSDPEQATADSVYYAYVFLGIGAATALACFLQIFMFSVAGEHLTLRLRSLSMEAMLRMEMGWFDLPVNSVGALCSKLASDASNVQGATGSRLGTILQSVCTIGASCIISLTLEWRLALVAMVFIPLVLASTFLQAKIIMGQSVTEMTSLEKANKVAIEAISNVRTVASLHKEKTFHTLYMDELQAPHEAAVRRSHLRGFVFGFSQSVPFFAYSACMFYGGKLIRDFNVDYEDVFKVAELLILGAMMVGQAMAFAPNVNKGVISSARIFSLLDKPSLIDSSSSAGIKLDNAVKGNVKFSGVHFSYPTRPGVKVLRGLDLQVDHGKVVALVGGSGCGKSTCIQLLERFYDPLAGDVKLDDHDVRKLNIQNLRAQIGIVSQEPVLFDRSIAANISYGDNSREVKMDEIIAAAKKANIHAFITSLPEGYNTSVGDKGTQLSGGQKQRIAIARALVRNPKILLLDEATSALDTESEKVVQEALEEAQKGRTCITVAHRLSTIKNADQIAVIYQGTVVEIGTHDELMAKKGHYYKFYETQAGRS